LPTIEHLEEAQVRDLVVSYYGLEGEWKALPSYVDQNFRLRAGASTYVVKVTRQSDHAAGLELEHAVMRRCGELRLCPDLVPSLRGEEMVAVQAEETGDSFVLRILTYLDGLPYAEVAPTPLLFESVGRQLGRMDRCLTGFTHPGMNRRMSWDMRESTWIVPKLSVIEREDRRRLLQHFILQFEASAMRCLPRLRRSVIHNDANDQNVLVGGSDGDDETVCGIIDFGDVVQTSTIFNLAIAAAYAAIRSEDPLSTICSVLSGYNELFAVEELELGVLFQTACMRLCLSVVGSTLGAIEDPDNEYIAISQSDAWVALERLREITPRLALAEMRKAIGRAPSQPARRDTGVLRARRSERTSAALSLSYDDPLHIVRGRAQYLFDDDGYAYLDCVNNVCHVGHCQPDVVAAAQAQIGTLNTNTRYLHANLVDYAARLADLFPDPLRVCFFVNSGSEANELALRLARTATEREEVVVLAAAYHGNTGGLVDLSPYKHNGAGGQGSKPWVHVAELPDPYRGSARHLSNAEEQATEYAKSLELALRAAEKRGGAAAFLFEALSGCGGQVEFPRGYLQKACAHARAAGALCIADEVQIGFGRMGSHFWGFATQDLIPDIVTLGKPIGNGHPLAAVVTTEAIAAAFANGMEYFSTFGGNPVSCAVGLAVLDVIESEGLQAHAHRVGSYLLAGLRRLQARFGILGDVRGRGLFLGVEFVRDPVSLDPAAAELSRVVEGMRRQGVLVSIDGPLHNVLKIKPPLPFDQASAELFLVVLEEQLLATAK
jgi:4-aminobutyrate aminotransferase-like enzyme/Ser/Thr protein kinase RdoA (MazF antagonist)